jgi:zinc finger protein-like protein
MAAAVYLQVDCNSTLYQPSACPPINFFYSHFHNAIRAELDAVSDSVSCLDSIEDVELPSALAGLKTRYHFLEQVYKYHSSVEDEVGVG